MKFKKESNPQPSKGESFEGIVDQVVPDQSLSLKDILDRFIRKEPLPVGHSGRYGSDSEIDPESDSEFNIDVEKARHWDLTERQEFSEKVAERRQEVEKAEKKRLADEAEKKAAADKKAFDKKVRMEARKLSKKPPEGGSI